MFRGLARHHSDSPLFVALLALLVWLPIPLGSNRPWAWSIFELVVFLISLLWLVGYRRGRCDLTPAFRQAWPVLAIYCLWLLHVALQTVPLPLSWVAAISPNAARLHGFTDAFAVSEWATLSVDPHATRGGWLKSLAYGCVLCMGLLLIRSRDRLRQFAYVSIFSGVLQALIGAALAFSDQTGQAHGTFVNRNHFAGYLEMCLAIGIGLLISQLSGASFPSNWKGRLRETLRVVLSTKAIIRLCLVAMVIGLVLSRSRMGNSAFFFSLIIAGSIGLVLGRHATRSMLVLIASLMIVDILIVGSWFGVEKVKQRIEETTLAKENRDEVGIYSIEYFKDFPVTGSGLGSFYAAFTAYRGSDVAARFEHAENDYLEFAAETGAIGLALVGSIVVLSLAAALLAHYRRRDPLLRGMSFAVIMGVVSLLIHSSVDFNLQIPANATMFVLLLAIGWICHAMPRELPDQYPGGSI